jgi:hypothetical protein
MRRKSTFIKNSSILILLFSLVYSSSAFAQSSKKKVYEVFRPNEECPVIDGKLDEPIWQKANWQNDFVQHQPSEGKPASQKTEFAILFDEHNIYIGLNVMIQNRTA